MRRLALLFVVLAGCARPMAASLPSASPTPETTVAPQPFVLETPTPAPTPVKPAAPPEPAMPSVELVTNAFPMSALVPPRPGSVSQATPWLFQFGEGFMNFLDKARGNGPWKQAGPVTDDEWNGRIFPGAFQQVARAAVHAKPADGRFFHLDSITADALYTTPWNADTQFVDVTMRFRDHAEYPPADEELFYTWHARLVANPRGPTGFADGYDGVTLKRFTSTTAFWTRAALENEAVSAMVGYLWTESYVAGGQPRYANMRDVTPFWHERIAAINDLNARFQAGTLTERRFEGASVRIDGFDPLTYFGGGIVTLTLRGVLVETSAGGRSACRSRSR